MFREILPQVMSCGELQGFPILMSRNSWRPSVHLGRDHHSTAHGKKAFLLMGRSKSLTAFSNYGTG